MLHPANPSAKFNSLNNPLALVIFGALTLGVSSAILREVDVGPIAAAFWRVAIAVPILASIIFYQRDKATFRVPQGNIGPLVWAGFFFAGDLIFWHLALVNTSLGNATLLATMSSIWVPLIGICFLGVKLSGRFVLGLTLAITGALLLAREHLSFSSAHWLGDFYGLITGFFFTGYLFAIAKCRSEQSTLTTMFYSSVGSAIFLLPVALVVGEVMGSKFIPASAEGWMMVIFLGLVAHVFAQGLIANGLSKLSTHVAAVVIMLEGVSAMGVGALFYQESRNWLDLIAVLVVTLGIYSVQSKSSSND